MSVLCLMFVCYVFAALDYARVLLQSTDDVSVRHTSDDESRSLPYRRRVSPSQKPALQSRILYYVH